MLQRLEDLIHRIKALPEGWILLYQLTSHVHPLRTLSREDKCDFARPLPLMFGVADEVKRG